MAVYYIGAVLESRLSFRFNIPKGGGYMDDTKLIFVGEYPREFNGIGVFRPGQRAGPFCVTKKEIMDSLLATGLFVPDAANEEDEENSEL